MKMLRFALLAGAIAFPVMTFAGAALAQEPTTGGRAIGAIFDGLGLRKPPGPAPDFVTNSRPETLDYAPLAPAPEKAKKRSPSEMQAVGDELDRAIAQNRRRAARVKIPN
jgi:hypothetical protein